MYTSSTSDSELSPREKYLLLLWRMQHLAALLGGTVLSRGPRTSDDMLGGRGRLGLHRLRWVENADADVVASDVGTARAQLLGELRTAIAALALEYASVQNDEWLVTGHRYMSEVPLRKRTGMGAGAGDIY